MKGGFLGGEKAGTERNGLVHPIADDCPVLLQESGFNAGARIEGLETGTMSEPSKAFILQLDSAYLILEP